MQAAKRLRSPETREGVRAFHARRRALDVPYDPGMDAATPCRPAGLWAEADARSEADFLAGREEAAAAAQRERKDRQREDRAGTRPFEVCKRARQEAFSIPCNPPDLGPAAAPAQRAVHTREAPWGLAARLRVLARRSGSSQPV